MAYAKGMLDSQEVRTRIKRERVPSSCNVGKIGFIHLFSPEGTSVKTGEIRNCDASFPRMNPTALCDSNVYTMCMDPIECHLFRE